MAHVMEESNRCLQCKKPRCKVGCPVETPINEVINLFEEGKILEAGQMLFENNPLSIVCSLVCPHEEQCEGNCILNKKGNPIKFGAIEHYISDFYLDNMDASKPMEKNGKKVAIIGSGPAGITIAILLANKGYDITIFEAHDKIGGVLRYGIPEFRLPKAIIDKLYDKLINMGVKIRPNTMIGPVITIDDLFRDGYKAVFIGTGTWRPNKLGLKGESLGHVHFAVDYLKNPDVYNLGKRLCIIGAGNVAMDVARTALRHGTREVTVMYRKGLEEVSASKHEVQYAKMDGVNFEFYKSPIEIVDDGVIYEKIEVWEDENGVKQFNVIEGSRELYEASSVIIAISQGPRTNIIATTKGIDTGNKGLVTVDDTGRTTRDGVFASGDVVTGARTVVEAVKHSKKVAQAIEEYINQLEN
ncbi:glutamate synthase (NADPH/NADH) small chain [Natranaerovirga pectinivora]|uniref:Glutamate synthase (NADPH/NADH) small chain n=1 Tax=Natranaerovirga pectinivora TaxID=682400 RepID=A0A4V2V0C4_9FIRM|nr:NAD(P)-dependent oxidoreductase [Natranaerovirga pectinivora]TCT15310.1 glutamate synthase (NADPH/NADH) small chain [Natranaerovirga pectinivora]